MANSRIHTSHSLELFKLSASHTLFLFTSTPYTLPPYPFHPFHPLAPQNHFDSLDQVNNLREIQALRRLSPHANIVKLLEVLYDQPTGRLALVFELMDMNIYEVGEGACMLYVCVSWCAAREASSSSSWRH